MAVPKKKISKSKGGMRRGGNGGYRVEMPNVVIDKTTGEYKLPHHISLDGYYNGKKVIADKKKKEEIKEAPKKEDKKEAKKVAEKKEEKKSNKKEDSEK
jgi:large subunit ribosomal protein L32